MRLSLWSSPARYLDRPFATQEGNISMDTGRSEMEEKTRGTVRKHRGQLPHTVVTARSRSGTCPPYLVRERLGLGVRRKANLGDRLAEAVGDNFSPALTLLDLRRH